MLEPKENRVTMVRTENAGNKAHKAKLARTESKKAKEMSAKKYSVTTMCYKSSASKHFLWVAYAFD